MLVLTACGGAAGDLSVSGGAADGPLLSCGDATWQQGELGDLPPLDDLPEDVVAAIDGVGEPVVAQSLPWRVAARGDTEVVLVRELGPDDLEAVDDSTHAALSLFRVDRDPDLPPGTWHHASGDVCTSRLAEGNEGERAEIRLADVPSPEDTSLQLLVEERSCASGRSAEGRIRVDDLAPTGDEVRLRVSVVPPRGDQTCASPSTPRPTPTMTRSPTGCSRTSTRPATPSTRTAEPVSLPGPAACSGSAASCPTPSGRRTSGRVAAAAGRGPGGR